MMKGTQGSPRIRQPVPPASGAQFPQPQSPIERLPAKVSKRKIPSESSQANDPKRKTPIL